MAEQLGPVFRSQMRRLMSTWKQGEHIVISGSTGSGKTALAREIMDIRLKKQGYVIVLLAKLQPDKTILRDYRAFKKWTKWKKLTPNDRAILIEPDVRKYKTLVEKRAHQREVFQEVINKVSQMGNVTLVVDEGLYMCDPKMMDMATDLAMINILGRSANITTLMLAQRPANIPLVFYGSASHAFVGQTREAADLKRLSEMGGRQSARELAGRLSEQGTHDFLWVPVKPNWPAETVNLRK